MFAQDDLLKLDQLVFSVRRHSRQLKHTVKGKRDSVEMDWVPHLQANPDVWRLSDSFPIEKAMAGKLRPEVSAALRILNVPFGKSPHPQSLRVTFEFRSSPLFDLYNDVKGATKTNECERSAARSVLQWAVDNITISSSDVKEIKKVLKSQQ